MTTGKAMYRDNLPQLTRRNFITDGGLETVFVFQEKIDLPLFAAISLINSDSGIEALKRYYVPYIELALAHETGMILDTPTWRASMGWGLQLGYSADKVRYLNNLSVRLLEDVRKQHATDSSPMVINGVIGPQSDGYRPTEILSADEAEEYHRQQVESFADSAADMVTAVTMTYVDEAIGIARAAAKADIPAAISFTVETDGLLPDGVSLQDAITRVDEASGMTPAYYMINCAHPSHFVGILQGDSSWQDRIYGVRANASAKSHAELDEATELDDGSPVEFGQCYAELKARLRNLRIVGGCCGTDHRHIGEVCKMLMAA